MTEAELRPFSKLYSSARYMSADELFRRFYLFDSDTLVPLSIAHGVDFGHCFRPMDIESVEPIHWSSNSATHKRASVIKPSLLLPHPWVMQVARTSAAVRGKGVLVVGPPPSPSNDSALYELIRKDVRSDWSILVKSRGRCQGSMRYWAKRGVTPITAGGPDSEFYARLHSLLSQYETVIGCTFSSALIFAASIGKRIELVRGFVYRAYEPPEYEAEVNFSSMQAKEVVRTFLRGEQPVICELARTLVGFEQGQDKKKTVREFRAAIEHLVRPFWNNSRLATPYPVREFLAMRTNKPRFLTADLRTYLRRLKGIGICIMSVSEFDVWANGKTMQNFRLVPTPYIAGVTEPGLAPEGYPE